MREKAILILLALIVIAIFLISGDGFYRYPCQNPNQWDSADCKPPICTAKKECPADLIGDGSA